MAGGAIIEKKLLQYGVKHVFGYSGGAVLPALDGFYGSSIEFLATSNENNAGHIAEGYAKSTGKCGMLMTTSGPGTTNLLTPLQDAFNDTVPLIAFTGQVPSTVAGTGAFQECNTMSLSKACTKWNHQLKTIEELPSVIDKAFYIAMSGKRGPVLIDLPKDIVSATITSENIPVFTPPEDIHTTGKKYSGDIDTIAKLINGAVRPVFIFGNGCIDAPEEARQAVEGANVPFCTTLHGMGIVSELHPLSMQMLGMHGAAYANYAIQSADLIVGIGNRFDDRTTGVTSKYAPEARKAEAEGRGGIIHFDIDRAQIGRSVAPSMSILGDCKFALKDLIPLLKFKPRTDWLAQIEQWRDEVPFKFQKLENGLIKTQQVIYEIYKATHHVEDKFISTGVGNHQMMSCQFYRWTKPRQILSSGSLGTMGVGLPFAIGAQIANPKSLVICVDGDGSFNMTCNEMYSVAKYKLPVKIAIMNDSRQQMVYVWQKLFFDKRYIGTENVNPDYCKLASAYDIPSVFCDNEKDLPGAIQEWLKTPGPCLAEFKVVPDICLPMVAPGKALDEMIINRDNNMNSVRLLSYIPKDAHAPS